MTFARRYLAWLLPMLLCALTGAAQAQTRAELERAETSFRAGAAAYAAGDYAASVQALEAAYAITPLPAIAFSLAQAERRLYFLEHQREHLEHAISLFRLYLKQVPTGGRRTDAVDAISQLEPLLSTLTASDPASEEARVAQKPTRLMITSDAPDVRIKLDDQPAAPSPLIREVTPGKHRVLVEAKGFHPLSREVTALTGELILNEFSLEPRPSQLVVTVPDGADVYVDGQYMSQGPVVTLSLPAGPHQLAVAARGRRVVYKNVVLERGEALSLSVALERTRRRKLARSLFIVSGVGFGASVTLAVLARQAQGQAEDFLDRREQHNVSPGELADYRKDVDRRDLLRTATDGALALSAALFVTGIVLHQLDRPSPREIHKHAKRHQQEQAAPQRSGEPTSLGFSPWAAGRAGGATLSLAF